jgi:hypothetical protein
MDPKTDRWLKRYLTFLKSISGETPWLYKESVNHRVRVAKINQFGEEVRLEDVQQTIAAEFRNAGFSVCEESLFIMVEKKTEEHGLNLATYAGLIRLGEQGDAWFVQIKGEGCFVAAIAQRASMLFFLGCIAMVVFPPLVCCIPFLYGRQDEDAKQWTQKNLVLPIDKVASELS